MGFTNASSNTFPPTTLQPLYRIWRDWCIGDSLGYLNDNFLYLETLINNQPPAGTIINVQQATNNTYMTITGIMNPTSIPPTTSGVQILSAAITPSSVNNKILVRFNAWGYTESVSTVIPGIIVRDNTVIQAYQWSESQNGFHVFCSAEILDSPATTTSTIYQVRLGCQTFNASEARNFYLNGPNPGNGSPGSGTALYGGRSYATLTLQEIKG